MGEMLDNDSLNYWHKYFYFRKFANYFFIALRQDTIMHCFVRFYWYKK